VIRRVSLQGWKAFEKLDFEPGTGVTFVVARNGFGKSSLIDGMAWAIFGNRSGIDAKRMLRTGHDEATTSVELELPGNRLLTIHRSTHADARADIDGVAVEDIDTELGTVLGADLDFVAQAVLVNRSTLDQQAKGFIHLEQHLASVFGVAALQDAAKAVTQRHAELKKANTKLRTERASETVNVRDATTQIELARTEELALVTQREPVAAQVAGFEAQLADARAAQEHLRRQQAWDEAMTTIMQIAVTIEDISLSDGVESGVRQGIGILEQAQEDLQVRIALAGARIDLANQGLASLSSKTAVCPTCQRPLSDEERERAETEHHTTIESLEADRTEATGALQSARARMQQLRAVLTDLDRLGPSPEAPALVPEDTTDIEGRLREAQEALRELDRQIGERQGVVRHHERMLTDAEAQDARVREVDQAIRLEAMFELASDTMTTTAARLLTERIEPISVEVAARWKLVFGDRGALRLLSDGTLVMQRGDHEIPFDDFSPGEQMVSMLALRFLTVSASTASPFMLLDEPLEDLDPTNRRIIGALLVGEGRPVTQMIVTTYEEPLVRRLNETVEGTVIRYLD
jgi:exonuclease SbcC